MLNIKPANYPSIAFYLYIQTRVQFPVSQGNGIRDLHNHPSKYLKIPSYLPSITSIYPCQSATQKHPTISPPTSLPPTTQTTTVHPSFPTPITPKLRTPDPHYLSEITAATSQITTLLTAVFTTKSENTIKLEMTWTILPRPSLTVLRIAGASSVDSSEEGEFIGLRDQDLGLSDNEGWRVCANILCLVLALDRVVVVLCFIARLGSA